MASAAAWLLPLALLLSTPGLSTPGSIKAQSGPPPVPKPPAAAPPLAPMVAPGKPDLPPLPAPPINHLAVQPAFSVVIDPAHGGANTGARIASNLLEKEITLGIAARLRAALAARGIPAIDTRDSDIDLPVNQRAGIANHTLASACLVLHATASGTGVHLFTSSLAPSSAANAAPNPVPWPTAQAAWITRSLRLTSEINSALGAVGVPATLGVASVAPIDNLACPAVAVEIAPLASAAGAASVADSKYQQRIIDALASALVEWRADWRQQP